MPGTHLLLGGDSAVQSKVTCSRSQHTMKWSILDSNPVPLVIDYIYNYITREICLKLNSNVHSLIQFSRRRGHFLLSFYQNMTFTSMMSSHDYDVIDIITFCNLNVIAIVMLLVIQLIFNRREQMSQGHPTKRVYNKTVLSKFVTRVLLKRIY